MLLQKERVNGNYYTVKKIIMKLELKYLSGYLPYELQVLNTVTNRKCVLSESTISKILKNSANYLLILRPFNDYKLIIESGKELSHSEIDMIDKNPDSINKISFEAIEVMLEHHVDIYRLIDKGLAVSIHDVV